MLLTEHVEQAFRNVSTKFLSNSTILSDNINSLNIAYIVLHLHSLALPLAYTFIKFMKI